MIDSSDVRFLSVAVLLTVISVLPAWGDGPTVEDAEPREGFVDVATGVMLTGGGIEPGASVAWLNGGSALLVGKPHTDPSDLADVALAGRHLFVLGHGLRIFDLSDPRAPVLLGTYDAPNSASRVEVSRSYAYVADGVAGLQIIDVSDPRVPILAGSFDIPGRSVDVAVSGNHAYVAERDGGLQIVDVSDPRAPVLAGSFDPPGSATDVVVSGDYAYVADRDGGLLIVDVSDPGAPVLAGSYDTPGTALSVAVSGDHAYVSTAGGRFEPDELLVIHVGDPGAPEFMGSLRQFKAVEIVLDGDLAYLACGPRGVRVIDVSDPRSPTPVDTYETHIEYFGVAVDADHAYVATIEGLLVLDIGNIRPPDYTAYYHTPSGARDLALRGHHVYVADSKSGLQIVDVSDPEAPTPAGSYDTPGAAFGVAVAGTHAFVADYREGLHVIDVADTSAPTFAAHLDTPGRALDIAVAGDYAYLAESNKLGPGPTPPGSLHIIDVGDPHVPHLVMTVETPGDPEDLVIDGDYAYVVAGDLLIFDVSDPQAPSLVASFPPEEGPAFRGLAVDRGHAYVSWGGYNSPSVLYIIDVTEPRAPTLSGKFVGPFGVGSPAGVAVAGDHAYFGRTSGLQVIDVSDPQAPALVGNYGDPETPGGPRRVAVAGDYAYVVGGDLLVIRPNPPLRDVSILAETTIELTVPAGLNPGPYHILVTNPGGEAGILRNGYRACERRALTGALEPVLDVTLPHITRKPLLWRLTLDGDVLFFEPRVRQQGLLMLPELPSNLEIRHEPGPMAIELNLVPQMDTGEVVLIGDDPRAMDDLWEGLTVAGGCSLPRLDDHTYGDVNLELSRARDTSAAQWSPLGGLRGNPVTPIQAPVRYRYDLSADGLLTEARAWGPDVDLVMQAVGEDRYNCETVATVSLVETSRRLCEELGTAHPQLALMCER